MAKDPTPKADMLRAQREARYGHVQATAPVPTPNEAAILAAMPRKLIPYAGKPKGNTNSGCPRAPVDKSPEAIEARKATARKRVKRKRRTELPPEGKTT